MLFVSSVRQLLHMKKFEQFSTRYQTFLCQIKIALFSGFINVFFALALRRRPIDKLETCFAVRLGSRAIYFPLLLCGWLSYCSKTTSFWIRLGHWRLIALYNFHKDQRVASSFSCNEIRKQSTLTASLKIFEMKNMTPLFNQMLQCIRLGYEE